MMLIRRLSILVGLLLLQPLPSHAAGKKGGTPTPKPKNTGGLFKKAGKDTPPLEDWPTQQKTTNVPGLDYAPRRQEKFDSQGRPTGMNLLINRVSDAEFRLRIKHASNALDDWARKIEEYGNVTMSSAILTRENDGFEFAIKDDAQAFYDHAKTRKDGGAAAVLAIVNQFSASGQATFDPLSGLALQNTIISTNAEQELYQRQLRANIEAQISKEKAADLLRDAKVKQIQASSATAEEKQKQIAAADAERADAYKNTPTKPSGSATELTPEDTLKGPTAAAPAAAQSQADTTATQAKTFTDLVLGGGTSALFPEAASANGLPDRAAMIDAAGTNTVKAIFKILGNPAAAMQFEDKTVFFATVTVAVNPGWRTKKDFAADISGQASYRMVKARTDVVEAFKDRIPDDYKQCILLNHGLQYTAPSTTTDKTAIQPGDSMAIQQAKLDLSKANAEVEKKQAEFDEAAADIQNQCRDVAAALKTTVNEAYKAPESLIPQANVPQAARYVGSTLTPSTKKLADGTADQKKQFAQTAVNKVVRTYNKMVAPEEWLDPSKTAAFRQDVKGLVEVLNAANQAQYRQGSTLDLVSTGTIQSAQHLEKSIAATEPVAQGVVISQAVAKEKEEHLATLQSGTSGNGIAGSGDGAGDKGALKVTKLYFDRVTFDKQPPLVAGISPLMETQVLDLKDRFGRQDQITIALAAAFRQNNVKGAASIFERFMKTQTKSANTLNSLPVVNTYSASGGLFGFQIGPRLRALEDPASRKGGSANVLDRQSFPAVLIIGADRADLSPRICRDYDGKYYLFEPQLVIKQTSRWNPLDGRLFTPFKTTWWNPFAWHNARYSERERVDDLLNVADNFRDLTQWLDQEDTRTSANANGLRFDPDEDGLLVDQRDPKDPKTAACFSSSSAIYNDDFTRHAYTDVVQSLVRRRQALKELSTGSESRQYLPLKLLLPNSPPPPPKKEPADPAITGVVPNAIQTKLLTDATGPKPQDVANKKAILSDATDDFVLQYGNFNTLVTADKAKVEGQLADDTKIKALAGKVYNITAGDPNAAQIAATRQALMDTQLYMQGILQVYPRANSRVLSLKKLFGTDAAPLIPTKAALKAASESVKGQVGVLAPVLDFKPSMNDDYMKALHSVGPILEQYKSLGTAVKDDTDRIGDAANDLADYLETPTKDPLIPIAILGENLGKTTLVEALLSTGEKELPKPGTKDLDDQSVDVKDGSISIKLRVGASAVLYLRVTCKIPDPTNPSKPRTVILYTPPVLIKVGDVAISADAVKVAGLPAEIPRAEPIRAATRELAVRSAPNPRRAGGKTALTSPKIEGLDLSQNILSDTLDR